MRETIKALGEGAPFGASKPEVQVGTVVNEKLVFLSLPETDMPDAWHEAAHLTPEVARELAEVLWHTATEAEKPEPEEIVVRFTQDEIDGMSNADIADRVERAWNEQIGSNN